MFKLFKQKIKIFQIVFALFVACAVAAPQNAPVVETVKFVNDIQENGYNFLYETSDGQKRDETGTLKDAPPTEDNPNNKVIDVVGSYEFTSPEGKRSSLLTPFEVVCRQFDEFIIIRSTMNFDKDSNFHHTKFFLFFHLHR